MQEIEELSIGGSLKFIGPVKFKSIEVAGSFSVEGSIEGKELTVSGSSKISGTAKISTVSVKGSMKVGDSLEYKDCEVFGSMTVTNSIKGEILDVSGSLKGESIEANKLTVRGRIESKSITADEIRVERKSHVTGTIVCNKISIGKEAEVDDVYGKEILVEKGAECGRVECVNIRAERNSEIDEIRYVESTEIDPRADVGRITKIESLSMGVPEHFMTGTPPG